MKQKKKADRSNGMGLVLMKAKKVTFDKTVRIARSKKRKKRGGEWVSKEKIEYREYYRDDV
ncbi:hypothetical protein AGMMS49990_03530 [Endomicrobiia bacterium]|nr:hypothetical protein AGMMS49990_03530 [Endomicrobiia bacterium]